jgi:hypothetical protein
LEPGGGEPFPGAQPGRRATSTRGTHMSPMRRDEVRGPKILACLIVHPSMW